MSPSKIEWTEETWNPTVGCSKVSPGCDHCYAINVAHRAMQPAHVGLTKSVQGGLDWTGVVRCVPERLDAPLQRRAPATYFVDSMSDLFHPDVPVDYIRQVFDVMVRARQHTFQVLTKRAQWMRALMNDRPATPEEVDAGCELGIWPSLWDQVSSGVPASNVWLGTSIESVRYRFRAMHLRATPAAVRFLSLEPLLTALPELDLNGINWVIVGGESGPGARPMDLDWARDIVDQCRAADVPVFVKQLGSRWEGRWHRDLKGGDIDTFPADLQVREMPERVAA
jgi:protein gp37